jgi:cobalt/nickel transport system permease protein
VVQLLFLNRYLFVLAEEAERMSRARALRSYGRAGVRFGIFIQLLGQLLVRTLDRAGRVYQAMLCRGFDGRIRVARLSRLGRREAAFVLGWGCLFAIFRFVNISLVLGGIVTGALK